MNTINQNVNRVLEFASAWQDVERRFTEEKYSLTQQYQDVVGGSFVPAQVNNVQNITTTNNKIKKAAIKTPVKVTAYASPNHTKRVIKVMSSNPSKSYAAKDILPFLVKGTNMKLAAATLASLMKAKKVDRVESGRYQWKAAQ